MSFGPPKGGAGGAGGFGTWGRGSQSAKTSRQETTNQNRFAQLDQSESGPPQSYDGRSSGGRFGRQNSQQDRGYGGRNSRGASGENDRAKAIQAVRDFGGNRSQSVMGPHPTVSRENSAPRSASMVVQKKAEVPGKRALNHFYLLYTLLLQKYLSLGLLKPVMKSWRNGRNLFSRSFVIMLTIMKR